MSATRSIVLPLRGFALLPNKANEAGISPLSHLHTGCIPKHASWNPCEGAGSHNTISLETLATVAKCTGGRDGSSQWKRQPRVAAERAAEGAGPGTEASHTGKRKMDRGEHQRAKAKKRPGKQTRRKRGATPKQREDRTQYKTSQPLNKVKFLESCAR